MAEHNFPNTQMAQIMDYCAYLCDSPDSRKCPHEDVLLEERLRVFFAWLGDFENRVLHLLITYMIHTQKKNTKKNEASIFLYFQPHCLENKARVIAHFNITNISFPILSWHKYFVVSSIYFKEILLHIRPFMAPSYLCYTVHKVCAIGN